MTGLQVTATVIDLAGHSVSRIVQATIIDQAYRDSLAALYGTYQPGSDTCGVIRGIPRDTVSALQLVPGVTYQNLDVTAPYLTVPVGTAPIIFRNVMFRGPLVPSTTSTALVRAWTAGHAPLEFWDCTVDPQTPDSRVNGIMGHTYKAHRMDISNVVDGFSGFNTAVPNGPAGVEIYGSWTHDHAFWPNPPDTSHSDGSHCDGAQLQGGSGYRLRGNNFEGFIGPGYALRNGTRHISQCLMIKPDVGLITGLDISGNWFSGGERGINFANDTTRMLGDVGAVNGNRFGRDQKLQGSSGDTTYTVTMPANVVCATVGNVYADNGRPILVRHNG